MGRRSEELTKLEWVLMDALCLVLDPEGKILHRGFILEEAASALREALEKQR